MSKQQLLLKFRKDVEELRNCANELHLSDAEIDQIFIACLKNLGHDSSSSHFDNKATKAQKYFYKISKIILLFICVIVFIYVLLNVHQPTSSIVLRNVQGLIYPGFKLVRYFSVPIIKKFPSLTSLYDESCLVENPYFYVSEMECWPCENVYSVIDLTGFNNQSLYQSGIPYIVKTAQKEVTFKDLKQIYLQSKDIMDVQANSIKSNANIQNLESLFDFTPNNTKSSTKHVTWRINKMGPARIIRSLFPRPYFLSEWSGQSMERYVMVDEPQSSGYTLPNMECSYIFLIQGSGERSIILKPSRECSENCRTVSVVLKPSYVLWYNWWYWRPISLPVENSTETSITYISSYC